MYDIPDMFQVCSALYNRLASPHQDCCIVSHHFRDLEMNTRYSLGRYVSPDGINISSVLPGAVYTDGGYWDTTSKTRPEHVEKYLKERMAIQRFGEPEEIGRIVAFLCSEHASFIVGSAFTVDGGQGRCFF